MISIAIISFAHHYIKWIWIECGRNGSSQSDLGCLVKIKECRLQYKFWLFFKFKIPSL